MTNLTYTEIVVFVLATIMGWALVTAAYDAYSMPNSYILDVYNPVSP